MWVIFLRAGAVLPFIAILGESGVRHPSGQEFARYASHGHARNVAGPSKDAVAVVVGLTPIARCHVD